MQQFLFMVILHGFETWSCKVPAWPGTPLVDQGGLEPMATILPQFPKDDLPHLDVAFLLPFDYFSTK